MEKLGKFIKIACLAAIFLTLFSVGWFLTQDMDFFSAAKGFLKSAYSKKELAAEPAVKSDKTVKMLMVGDIMLDRQVKVKAGNRGLAYIFQGLEDNKFDFFRYDLVNANLEGAVTNGGAHYPPVLDYDFAFLPELVGELKDYNFSIFNLANNHVTDQGERGLVETGANLARLGFNYYGCRDGKAGGCSNLIYYVGDLKIGLAGFSQVYKKIDQERTKAIIAALENQTDLVVVNIHWGVEYGHSFNQAQAELAHKLVDAGADIIIGHHPHVVQGIEVYKRKPIFYSLGNFIFDQYFSADTQEELAAEIDLGPSGQVVIVLYPLISRQSQPSLMTGRDREKYLKKIAGWSKGDEELKAQIKIGIIKINL